MRRRRIVARSRALAARRGRVRAERHAPPTPDARCRRPRRGGRATTAAVLESPSVKPISVPRSAGERPVGELGRRRRRRRCSSRARAGRARTRSTATLDEPGEPERRDRHQQRGRRPGPAGGRPCRSAAPITSTSAYMPTMCEADDREHVGLVVAVVDDEVAGQVHHARPSRRSWRRRRRAPSGTPGRRRISRSGAPAPRTRAARVEVQLCAIVLGSGRTQSDEHEADDHDPGGREPRHDERLGVELLAGEERPEDERPERCAEERAEEDVGDAAGAPLGRVHVGRGGAREQDRALRDADEREAGDRRARRTRARSRGPSSGSRRCRRRSRPRAPARGRSGPSGGRPGTRRARRRRGRSPGRGRGCPRCP